MPSIKTVTHKEEFLIQMNGDYNVPFDEIEVTGTFPAGTILENATTAVSSSSTGVLGILAEDVDGTAYVRVMTRGNPSTVDGRQLAYADAVVADINGFLADAGIVVK